MDFRLSPKQEALRAEIRAFLQEHVPPDHPESHIIPEEGTDEEWEWSVDFTKKMIKRGWFTGGWPKGWGGLGWGPEEGIVLSSELHYAGALCVNNMGMATAGMLFRHGTDEQLKEHLPGIASAEVIWAEGYSEPDAGSDLASLTTTGIRDGDDYIINGTKIWTGQAHRADWMFVFTRTAPDAPKHLGISYLLADLRSPGITIRPLMCIGGVVSANQEYFENVRMSRRNLIGEENQGWRDRGGSQGHRAHDTAAVNAAIPFPNNPFNIKRHLEQLVAYCGETNETGIRLAGSRSVRYKLADLAIATEIACARAFRGAVPRALGEDVGIAQMEGHGIFNRELNQRLAATAVNILGMHGELLPEDRWSRMRGWFARSYLFTVASTIYGGTVEIHRNTQATRGLGLPRG